MTNVNFVETLAEILGKPTTYATLTALLGVAGFSLAPGYVQDITFAGMAFSAVAGVILKEGVKQALSSGDAVNALANLESRVNNLENNTPAPTPVASATIIPTT